MPKDAAAKRRLAAEKKRIKAYNKKVEVAKKDDPVLECTFTNLETPGVDLEFTFERERYILKDGKKYPLRIGVIEHLNGLQVPVRKYKTDPETGQLMPETEIATFRKRFSVTPTSMREYTKAKSEE